MDHGEVRAQLAQLVDVHDGLTRGHLVGGSDDGVATGLLQEDFLRHRERVGIGDQILADLGVDVVGRVAAVDRVKADGHPVGPFVRIVGMQQDTHRGGQVVDAMEVAFSEGTEVPEAGVHLFDALGDVTLVGVLGPGVVQPGAAETGRSSLLVLERQRIEVPAGNDSCNVVSAVVIQPGVGATLMASRSVFSSAACVPRSARKSGSASRVSIAL